MTGTPSVGATTPSSAPLIVRHVPWDEPFVRPAMANERDRRADVGLTSRYVERHGRPAIPVSGEIHYSRVPRHRWAERLRLLRSGGVTVASAYVIWNHHQPDQGPPRFDGRLDVGAFVDTCAEVGLDVVLRIGPWAHGEVRNGGFPDHVQAADIAHRTDEPGYLDLVRQWWGHLGRAVADRCGPDGPVVGIQVDNELYDQPDHLATLVTLAREAGLHAPLWTATAWGGAQLPPDVVLPVFGGYVDGFWVDADRPWHPTFRAHLQLSHEWDDPGIGEDLREVEVVVTDRGAAPPRTPVPQFPVVTCELGGGMATAYHRRPWPQPLDVATVAHVKVGSGSAWQGYYMYAGGLNPGPGLQESHATGYPNDLPVLDYDFHAPVGASGALSGSHAELRRQHAALAAFGDRLAPMASTLPDVLPDGVADATTLRWAVRSDGDAAVLFVAWHQPHEPLQPVEGMRFAVGLDAGTVTLPSGPVTVPPGTLARWPVRWRVGDVRLAWATASLLTELPGDDGVPPTLVLTADAGIPVELAVQEPDGGGTVHPVPPGSASPVRLTSAGAVAQVLVVDAADAARLWVQESPRRRLLRSADTLGWGADGALHVLTEQAEPSVEEYDPVSGRWLTVALEPAGPPARSGPVAVAEERPAGEVPAEHGRRERRQSAPHDDIVDRLAAVHRLGLPAWAHEPSEHLRLRVDWAGDVGRLLVGGLLVADRFWDGSEWEVELRDVGPLTDELQLQVLPLHPRSGVHLPADAAERLASSRGPLGEVVRAHVVRPGVWREVSGPAG